MIVIGMNPNMLEIGGFVVTWHGFFAFVAVLVAVALIARWAPTVGIISDTIYSTAIWVIMGGILGARAVHVIDRWDFSL